jgi:hypothetical protein
VFFSQSVAPSVEDFLQRAERLARSSRAGRHGDMDIADWPHLHHETWWKPVLSRVSRSDRQAGVADVDATEHRGTRTHDADPTAD